MTLTIVDSTVLIDASRSLPVALRFLRDAAAAGPVASSVLVRTELWVGARPDERARISGLFDQIEWHDVTLLLADLAASLGEPYRRSHRIETVDLILAATAIEFGGTLATLNVRDFPMFPGLQPPY